MLSKQLLGEARGGAEVRREFGPGLAERVVFSGNNMKLRNGQTKNMLRVRDPSFVSRGGEEGSGALKL